MYTMLKEEIGQNIRHMREKRNLSQADMVQRMKAAGAQHVSAQGLSMVERGEATCSAEHLHYAAVALNCAEQVFFHADTSYIDEDTHFRDVMRNLSPHHREIIHYLFFQWDGDVGAVLENVAAYICMEDEAVRAESSGINIMLYKKELDAGRVSSPVQPDLKYLERAHRKLERAGIE